MYVPLKRHQPAPHSLVKGKWQDTAQCLNNDISSQPDLYHQQQTCMQDYQDVPPIETEELLSRLWTLPSHLFWIASFTRRVSPFHHRCSSLHLAEEVQLWRFCKAWINLLCDKLPQQAVRSKGTRPALGSVFFQFHQWKRFYGEHVSEKTKIHQIGWLL